VRELNCLDRDREHKSPAPRGSVRSESVEERLQRLFLQAASMPASDPRAARWHNYFERTIEGRRY